MTMVEQINFVRRLIPDRKAPFDFTDEEIALVIVDERGSAYGAAAQLRDVIESKDGSNFGPAYARTTKRYRARAANELGAVLVPGSDASSAPDFYPYGPDDSVIDQPSYVGVGPDAAFAAVEFTDMYDTGEVVVPLFTEASYVAFARETPITSVVAAGNIYVNQIAQFQAAAGIEKDDVALSVVVSRIPLTVAWAGETVTLS